ncbi:hypothetical protein PtrM4_054060 [Pyrenophora tritici-repentis]|uniref:Chromo domain-containing protein n=1 Tax=Pyrenophora tritici-repentis TaxID=45151 RepID=A0A834VLA8_9PLEO|nr:hypothetical protein PtrM4_054060 [Pyrenophora tritici-repentis]
MRDVTEFIREEMIWAQAMQQEYTNRKRLPALAYEVGDEVWLDARNIRTQRASKKLDWKNFGPYRVAKKISSYVYRLDPPATMKIHPHVPPPELFVVDGEPHYFVESVENLRYNKRRKRNEYLVKWVGYKELSWEPAEELKENDTFVRFHEQFPEKPKPPMLT